MITNLQQRPKVDYFYTSLIYFLLRELVEIRLRIKLERRIEKLSPFKIILPPSIYRDINNWPTCWKANHQPFLKRIRKRII